MSAHVDTRRGAYPFDPPGPIDQQMEVAGMGTVNDGKTLYEKRHPARKTESEKPKPVTPPRGSLEAGRELFERGGRADYDS